MASYLIFWVAERVKPTVRWAVIFIICLFTILPTVKNTIGVAALPQNITPGWYNALTWMRYNTPSQFESDVYYEVNVRETPSYGVLTWWDYGDWIIRIAHRVPTSNPMTWGVQGAFRFYPAQSTEDAESWIKDLKIRYVLVDGGGTQTVLGEKAVNESGQEFIIGKFLTVLEVCGIEGDPIELWESSMAYKLFYGQVDGYKLIHTDGEVKIFEREDWNN